MKYLALALLLAVGSQAAPMTPDQAIRTLDGMRMYMDGALDGIKRLLLQSLSEVGDQVQRAALEKNINDKFDDIHTRLQDLRPRTDAFTRDAMERTADMRLQVHNDVEELVGKVAALHEVLNRHQQEYSKIIEQFVREQDMERRFEDVNTNVEQVMERLTEIVPRNAEETRNALQSIGDTLREKAREGYEAVRPMATAYVDEYGEYVRNAAARARANQPNLNNLWLQVKTKAEEIRPAVEEIVSEVRSFITAA